MQHILCTYPSFFEAFETEGNFNIQDLDEFRHTFFRRDGDDHLCYEKVQFIKRQKPFKVSRHTACKLLALLGLTF